MSTLRAQNAAPEPAVEFALQRVEVKGSSVGNLGSKYLLTSVDTIGGEAVQDAAVSHNWELFGRLPGVQLTNYNQGTISGRPSMRGFNGEGMVSAVKLLIDGVPSNTNDGAMPFLDLVMPLGLAGITAVRGTNDARYGLHSIAGNLEMLTREGGNATNVRVGAGRWGKSDVQLAVDREAGGLTQNYSFGARHTDGWRDHSKADQASLAAKWGYAPQGSNLRFGLALRAHHAEAEEPGFLTAADAYTTPQRSYAVSATDGGDRKMGQASFSVDGHHDTLSWRGLVYVNRFDDTRFVRFSAGVSQQERVTDETHRGARVIVSWRPRAEALAGFALEGGVDTERQRNASRRYTTNERARGTDTQPVLDLRHHGRVRAGRGQADADLETGARLSHRPHRRPLRRPAERHRGRHQRLRHDPPAQDQRGVVAVGGLQRVCQLGAHVPGGHRRRELQDPAAYR
jgi:iron complex outermembrane receptor protein